MNRRKACLLLFFCSCLLILTACVETGGKIEYRGRELSEEEIREQMLQGLPGETESRPPRASTPWNPDAACAPEARVYWTKSGSVYHLNEYCRYLPDDAALYYGTAEEAQAAHKSRCCSACGQEK